LIKVNRGRSSVLFPTYHAGFFVELDLNSPSVDAERFGGGVVLMLIDGATI